MQHPPVQCYPLSQPKREELKKFIEENLSLGCIWPSTSPYASPFFFCSKPSLKELWGIQDYHRLNEIMVKDWYPLPLISEVIGRLTGSTYFFKMDLQWEFNNVRIRESDEVKAAFITPEGLYKPMVMQFRLCNAPTTSQRMVDPVLAEERSGSHVKVYIDDILVHTLDWASNQYWMKRVLDKLRTHNLCHRGMKCQFKKEQVDFLGMTVTNEMVRVSEDKVSAVKGEKALTSKKGVRQFLGMTNYHWQFI
jgi:hypothetical protein